MPNRADDPLRKVTLNLYEADCALMETMHGHGWSTVIRDVLNHHCNQIRPMQPTAVRKARTLGDLADD